jgi:hypothetical protein
MQLPLTRSRRRRAAAAMATLGLVIGGASVLVAASATAHRDKRSAPSLILGHRNPVTVRGRGFQPRVRVGVRLVAARTFSRHAVPNRAGAFTVTFPAAVIDRCSSWSVSASQRRHATLVLRGPPKPQCAPASSQ